MHIPNFRHFNHDRNTMTHLPLIVFIWMVCTSWLIPLLPASAETLPPQDKLIEAQVSSNGAANVEIQSYANALISIQLLEVYPNILPEECQQIGTLPRHCFGSEFRTEVYHGYIQTDSEGKASLAISGQGYYHLELSLVQVPDEIKDSLAPGELLKNFQIHIGLEATDSCARVPEVTFERPLFQFGENVIINLKPQYIHCEDQLKQPHTYTLLIDKKTLKHYSIEKGTPLAIPGAQPGFKYHFEFLDESCNHKTSNWYDEYFFTNMISEPQLPQTKEEYENASTIPSHTRIYPSSLPMGKNNAFTIKAYQELFAKKIEVLNQILGEAEVTVYLTDEYMNLAKDIPDYHFEDIHVYMCTKKCTELILKRQEQNAFTYFVPKQYYGEDTGVYIYAGSHNTTKDAIKVVILPDYLKRLKIILTILFIIGAIVGTITIKNRIYFNKILPPLPGPNDDLKDHIIQYVNTVYKELFNKKMDKTSEPAKLLYQEAESMNISNLKSLEQYCMLIHTALKNEITKETIKTIRKETIKIIKKTKPES